ncbi:MAG: hypothetical protein ACREO1_07990 [Arenimonas sp.]
MSNKKAGNAGFFILCKHVLEDTETHLSEILTMKQIASNDMKLLHADEK